MVMNDSELTPALKSALHAAWSDGQRELVLLTFKASTLAGDADIARWIHATFKHDFNDAELEDLGRFAAEIVVMRFAQQLANNLSAQSTVNAAQAAKDVIARAMAH
jgi:hypothetical protein